MINGMNLKDCIGCGACSQICPQECITMVKNEEGFDYPSVDKSKCLECGLCTKHCPVIKIDNTVLSEEENNHLECYAAFSRIPEIRERSSSGGVFSHLAIAVLREGGVVFGAAYDQNWMVHHIQIDSIKDLHLIIGSKYLQSRIDNTYSETRKLLEAGRTVLYSGTPCQIAGLKSYLKKEYTSLYTVDVLCHGVPSPEVWRRYLSEKEKKYGSKATDVSFRDKKTGWNRYSVKISFAEREYSLLHTKDVYMQLFLNNICLRPSCHCCRYKSMQRLSDITIGDAWGIQDYLHEMNDDKGTSLIFVHTDAGQNLLERIKSDLTLKSGELERFLPGTSDARNSVRMNNHREKFFYLFNQSMALKKLVKLTYEPMRVRLRKRKEYAVLVVKIKNNLLKPLRAMWDCHVK